MPMRAIAASDESRDEFHSSLCLNTKTRRLSGRQNHPDLI